jgi:hypothetical protein
LKDSNALFHCDLPVVLRAGIDQLETYVAQLLFAQLFERLDDLSLRVLVAVCFWPSLFLRFFLLSLFFHGKIFDRLQGLGGEF